MCGGVFWFLYSRILAEDASHSVAALQGMMWPFTVVMLGIPLLVFLAFGGLRAIRELVSLQAMVAAFPKDIQAMQDAVQVFKSVKDDIARARDDLVRVRTDISLASSEISQNLGSEGSTSEPAEQRQASIPTAGTASEISALDSDPGHLESFDRMYRKAKRYYRTAVQKYTQSHPDDRTFNAGDDWIEITKRLRDLKENYFDPGRNKDRWFADWVVEMIETERSTRRNRLGRLDPARVKELEDGQPPD
jgi:hypothetical protein